MLVSYKSSLILLNNEVQHKYQMENGEALGALGDALQVERVNRVRIPTDFADEAFTLAEDTGKDVFAAKS